MFPGFLPTRREIIVDRSPAQLTFLGGDEHYAIGSTGTVDGTRGSVLQHLYRLDVAGVDVVDATLKRHTVDDVERVAVINGTRTTYTDARTSTGLSGRGRYVDTGCQTLQGIVNADGSFALQVLSAHLGNGCGHYAFFLHTVTDDHHLVQCGLVFLQYNAHLVFGHHLLSRVADVRDNQRFTLCHLDGKLTIHVGDGGVLGIAFLHDGGTDNGFTTVISHGAQDSGELGVCGY